MLPDFLEAKREASDSLDVLMRELVRRDPVMEGVQRRHVFEGSGGVVVDRGEEFASEVTHIRLEGSVSRDEIITLGIDAFIPRVIEHSREMQNAQARAFFALLEKTTAQTGNVIRSSAPDSPTFEEFCEAYEKREWTFAPDGTPSEPSIFCAPGSPIVEKLKAWSKEPECTARLEEIRTRKRAEWDARESHRQLVD